MAKKYVVQLTAQERQRCLDLIRAGQAPARSIMHARVLLKSDCGPDGPGWTDDVIGETLKVSTVTVAHIRQTMVTEGLDAAVHHYQTGGREYARKLDGHQEAQLIALACSPPPEGHVRWTLRLLASRMVELGYAAPVSYNTVDRVLKKRTAALARPAVVSQPRFVPQSGVKRGCDGDPGTVRAASRPVVPVFNPARTEPKTPQSLARRTRTLSLTSR